ncbi:MAG: hypothetical protein IPK79_02565 [Vampirovibrionales bacterium]|nr:hypothetical protein [Vampirovibrionales bacterium]
MNIPPIESLLETVQDAESALTRTMLRDGRHVSEYRDALKRFAVAWFVLEKSRQPEEFLPPPGAQKANSRVGSHPRRFGVHQPV